MLPHLSVCSVYEFALDTYVYVYTVRLCGSNSQILPLLAFTCIYYSVWMARYIVGKIISNVGCRVVL